MHDQKAKSHFFEPIFCATHNPAQNIEGSLLPPDTTYFYILTWAVSQEGAKLRAEWFMRRRTYGVRDIYATEAKRINLTSWEVEVVVIKSS